MLRIGLRWRAVVKYLTGLCAIVWAAAITHPACADTITLQGSTTFNAEVLAPHLAEIERASRQQLTIIPNKTTPGLVALLEGKADLAMLSTPLEPAVASARKSRPHLPYERLMAFSIARTRVALALHPANRVRTVPPEMLRGVLRGEITNWRELGGADLPIRVVTVREGGGVRLTVENELLGGDPIAAKNAIVVPGGPRIIRVVAQEPGALGITQLNLVRGSNLPELALDRGIVQELNLVSLGEPTPAAKAVIDAARHFANSATD